MNNSEARRHIQHGARDPQFRQTGEYRAAMRHTTAHYRGLNAGAADRRAMTGGASSKTSCALLTVFAVVACTGWPVAAFQALGGWVA